MRRLVALAVLALMSACVSQASPRPSAKPTEPTFWEVCYRADGVVESYEGQCDEPQEITWQLPVRVYLPRDYPDRLKALEAMKAWNGWLGTDVYVASDDPESRVSLRAVPENPFWAGLAAHKLVDGSPKFDVQIAAPYTGDVDVLAHELGHVLGLAHDPGYHRSIMDPGPAWYLPAVTHNDCRALTRKYHLKHPDC